jgi:hypothetical protein
MNRAQFAVSEEGRTRVRMAVVAIGRQMTCLCQVDTVANHRAATSDLASSWAGLVELLAVERAPEVRECPICRNICRRTATRCGYCWNNLSPVTENDA